MAATFVIASTHDRGAPCTGVAPKLNLIVNVLRCTVSASTASRSIVLGYANRSAIAAAAKSTAGPRALDRVAQIRSASIAARTRDRSALASREYYDSMEAAFSANLAST